MRVRLIWMELAAIGLGLVLIQVGALFVELQTSMVTDWFITLAPLSWVNVSVLFLYALFRQFRGVSEGDRSASPSRWRGLQLDAKALRGALGRRESRLIWLACGLAYALGYMLLQGILVVDLTGTFEVGVVYLPSPIGYGPALAWSPAPAVGMLLRPYTLAAAVALSTFSGLILALFVRVVGVSRRHVLGVSGPLAGLAVICPACIATPAAGLFLAYLAPAATLVGLGTLPLFSATLAASTALLVISLFLLWWTVAWLSRLAGPTRRPVPSTAGGPEVIVAGEDRRTDQGDDEDRLNQPQRPDEA